MIETTATMDNFCPYCGHKFNRASSLTEKVSPKSGDWSVCIACAAFIVFNEDLTVRKPTHEEAKAAAASEVVFRTQLAVRRLIARNDGKIIAGGGTA